MDAPTKPDTRGEILKTTLQLLGRRSYHSFSYNDISQILGIKKSSIHYHFPSKEILAVESVKKYYEKIEYLLNKLDNFTTDPWVKLDEFFNFFKILLERNEVCVGGILTAEVSTLPNSVTVETIKVFNRVFDYLANLLKISRDNGIMGFSGDPRSRAVMIMSSIEGALLLSRMFNNIQLFTDAIQIIIRDLCI
ncbi:MAG: TetR/AcrR family transcriptional regulator [Candidatus Heimdallarchaeota archaeon]|nr:TetR/AcrR family transcriptional regulator [Candidatus Heimdallarchaeota archaeon]